MQESDGGREGRGDEGDREDKKFLSVFVTLNSKEWRNIMNNSEQCNSNHLNDLSENCIEQNDELLNSEEFAPYGHDRIENAYEENPYEINVFDNAYTESFTNPNPKNSYSKQKSGWELE